MYVFLGDRKLQMLELSKNVVPKYAAVWRDLGMQLKIPSERLDAIAVNHGNHPHFAQQCCTAVLRKWLDITPNATWNMLRQAIDSLPDSKSM